MNKEITLVNRGRGLQLSTHRARVQDLVPFFQEGSSYEEILRWIPTLTREASAAVEQYYREHKQELDDEARIIDERNAQRKNPAWVEKVLDEGRAQRLARMDELRAQKPNGEPQ